MFIFYRDNYSKPTWGLARLALPTHGLKFYILPT